MGSSSPPADKCVVAALSLLDRMTVRDETGCYVVRDFARHAKSAKAATVSAVPYEHDVV